MADFYGTVAAADAYHTARLTPGWTGTADAKQAALIRASVFVDTFGVRRFPDGTTEVLWSGVRTGGRAQRLAWPRTGATDSDGVAVDPNTVPVEVEYAAYEAAARELAAPGSLSPDYVASAQVKREKVDVIEVEYATVSTSGGRAPNAPIVGIVADLLAPLLVGALSDGLAIYVV